MKMWPFNKKEDEFDWDGWNKKWPPGKEFEYMDIKFKVVTNYEVTYGLSSPSPMPFITGNYVDNNGVIRSKCFSLSEIEWANDEKQPS
jgi:hypothetical protein